MYQCSLQVSNNNVVCAIIIFSSFMLTLLSVLVNVCTNQNTSAIYDMNIMTWKKN